MNLPRHVMEQIERAEREGRVVEHGQSSAPAPDSSEKEFQARVVREARRCGWRYYHTFDSRKSVAGFPDLILLRGDRCIAAELKVGRNTVTDAQAEWLRAFHEAGIEVAIWRPEYWPAICEALK